MAPSNIDKQSFGQAGATMLTGTDTVTADICAILILEDAIFDGYGANATTWAELTDVDTEEKMLLRSDDDDDGVTLTQGMTIYGQFSKVTLRSGTVLCYHAA
jgi:hypothetical protein